MKEEKMVTRRTLLGSAVGSALLAACGGGGGGGEQAAAPSSAPVSLRYVHQWGAPCTPQLEKMLTDFTAKHPNVKAEQVRSNGEIHEQLVKALAGGEPPDVTMMWRSNMPGFAAKGGLTTLDPYM